MNVLRSPWIILVMAKIAFAGTSAPATWAQTQGGATAAQQTTQPGPERPVPPDWLLPSAIKLIQQERYEDARQLLTPFLNEHPGWGRLQFIYGLTFHKQNRYEQARPFFERALELDPGYQTVRVFYGWCLYYLAELDRAAEQFQAFLALKPDYPDAIFALGLIDFDNDHIDAARQKFEKVIELAQKVPDRSTEAKARARLADVWIRQEQWEKAKGDLERSLELHPDNYEPWYKLSRVLDRLGDREGAARARQKHDEVRDRLRPAVETKERKPVN